MLCINKGHSKEYVCIAELLVYCRRIEFRRSDNELKIANLISKLNFYKLIPYPMDNCLSGWHRPARQTPEKDVLCLHRPAGPSTVHSQGGASYFLPV